ncbi:MAG: Crp/Fnr family transcriptional regulator [Clostridia bacterium]|nr:Crp/Fnr family transcriptional regulator [Clostridia bacterium]
MKEAYNLTSPVQQNPALEALIRRQATAITLPAKKIISEAESPCEGVYYIAGGQTRHYLLGADGTEKVILVLSAGWFFQEVDLILQTHVRLYAVTEEKSELLFIPREVFVTLMHKEPLFSEAIHRSQALKAAILLGEIESTAFHTGKDRLLKLFYHNTDPSFPFDGKWYSLKKPYTQQELGTMLGVSRVTVSKFINEFCDDGIIRIVNRRMQINIDHYNRLDEAYAGRV